VSFGVHRRFGVAVPHLQQDISTFCLPSLTHEDDGTTNLRNTRYHSPNDTASYLRRPASSRIMTSSATDTCTTASSNQHNEATENHERSNTLSAPTRAQHSHNATGFIKFCAACRTVTVLCTSWSRQCV
jgi:hypothetical protein